MKRGFLPLTVLLLLASLQTAASDNLQANNTPVVQKLNAMPLSFTQNNGQWDSQVLFRANSGGTTMWFTRQVVTFQFTRRIACAPGDTCHSRAGGNPTVGQNRFGFDVAAPSLAEASDGMLTHSHLDRGLRGVSDNDSIATKSSLHISSAPIPIPKSSAKVLMDYKCNYFLGNDPTKWHTDVPNYTAVVYKDIYPGIDLRYYGNGDGKMEYDFIIQPHADPSQIAIHYDGAKEVCVDEDGQLVVETEWGKVTEHAPIVCQVCRRRTKRNQGRVLPSRGEHFRVPT